MALLEDILTWSKDLPDWQRDALRRIFATDGQLAAKDLEEIRAMAEGDVGAPKPTPLSKSHIPTLGSGTSTILLGLSALNNVNGFTNGRQLNLIEKGIAVIFGENGSGKSGFARVMKRACRARHSTPVLSNAFAKGTSALPEATFSYVAGGKNQTTIWTEGGTGNPDLAMVSVYDSQCAQDYISNDGPSTFVPYGFHALSSLAVAQQSIQEDLNREIGAILLRTEQFDTLQGVHSVGKFISKLGPDTELATLEALAKLTPQETGSIQELSAAIKGLDVEPEAIKHERLAQRLDHLANLATNAERFVTDAALDKFAGLPNCYVRALEREGTLPTGVGVIDPSEAELAAMQQCLKPLGEAAGEIGMDRPLSSYTQQEALALINAVVTTYVESMVQEHERSKYPPVRMQLDQ